MTERAIRAYIMLRTRYGTSKQVIETLRKNHERSFIDGAAVYGWYDAVVELEVPHIKELNEIVDELKANCLDITHIGTAIEKTGDAPNPLLLGR